MVWSKYNYFLEIDNKYFLYNSLSNSFAELDLETFNELKRLRQERKIPDYDKDFIDDLKRMKALVEDDRDEINKIKYFSLLRRFNNKTLSITINPTLDCNFACPYCFEGTHRHVYMTDSVEDQCIEFIKKHAEAKNLNVTWFGGEPLLAFKRIVSLTEKIKLIGLKYDAGMITNGYLLNKNIIKRLKDLSITSMQITLDGLAPIHDKRRCLINGGKTFDKITQNIDLLKQIAPEIKVSVRVNIDKTNEDDFIYLYKIFADKQYPNLMVYPAFVDDITDSHTNCNLFDCQRQVAFWIQLYKKYSLDFSHFYPKNYRYECAIRNQNSIVIGPKGELYKCWNDVGLEDKIIGYVDGRIINERLLLRYLNGADPFDDPKCQECILLPVCGGGCPYTRLQNMYEGKNINTCELIKNNLDEFLLLQYHIINRKNKS